MFGVSESSRIWKSHENEGSLVFQGAVPTSSKLFVRPVLQLQTHLDINTLVCTVSDLDAAAD